MFRLNEIEIAAFEWNARARGRGPTLLMAHATGFHARCWDQIIHQLGDRHVVAVDLRGHGRSSPVEIEHWHSVGRDLFELVEALDLESIVGVGHSMGGHAMVDAAALAERRFCGLFLFDPVIGAPETYTGNIAGAFAEHLEGGHPISRRRNVFDSPQAMFDRFVDRPPYGSFDERVLRDYCEFGLLPSPDGGFVLACRPSVEASVYMSSRSNTKIFDSVKSIHLPTLIIRAKSRAEEDTSFDFSTSPTWPGLVDLFANAEEIHLPKATHFLPFEDPAYVAERIVEHVERAWKAAEGSNA